MIMDTQSNMNKLLIDIFWISIWVEYTFSSSKLLRFSTSYLLKWDFLHLLSLHAKKRKRTGSGKGEEEGEGERGVGVSDMPGRLVEETFVH